MTGLRRNAATIHRSSTVRTCEPPSQILHGPRIVALSRLKGPTPTSAAICFAIERSELEHLCKQGCALYETDDGSSAQ
jgi:hypothetical protein